VTGSFRIAVTNFQLNDFPREYDGKRIFRMFCETASEVKARHMSEGVLRVEFDRGQQASSGDITSPLARCDRMGLVAGGYCMKSGLRNFLPFQVRVHELMSFEPSRIEPSYDRSRLHGPSIRESNCSLIGWCEDFR
jgi:hypothetical protein